jgi:hypothetical protein
MSKRKLVESRELKAPVKEPSTPVLSSFATE